MRVFKMSEAHYYWKHTCIKVFLIVDIALEACFQKSAVTIYLTILTQCILAKLTILPDNRN